MARVLLVDDEIKLLRLLSQLFAHQGHQVGTASRAEEAEELLKGSVWDLLVTDVRLPKRSGIELMQQALELQPGIQVIVISAYGTVTGAVEAMRLGAYDYLLKPFELEGLLLIADRALESARLAEENLYLRARGEGQRIIAESASMAEVVGLVERVGPTDATVLLLGESGAGKEILARRLHQLSPRNHRGFVRVNCPAIPHNLLESELFGHIRGAFTGAESSRKGKVELAQGGTLFLDEVADLPLEQQAKILHLLENRTYSRVGCADEEHADVRILAATNYDLRERVDEGLFRQDLYYRLNVVPVQVPPLRERPEDLPGLCDELLARLATRLGRPGLHLAPEALRALSLYHWSGNVRELRNVLERAAVLSGDDTLRLEDLPGDLLGLGKVADNGEEGGFVGAVERFKRSTLLAALRSTGWHKKEAADRLGISARAMSHYVKRYDLDRFRAGG